MPKNRSKTRKTRNKSRLRHSWSGTRRVRQLALAMFGFGFLWTGLMAGHTTAPVYEAETGVAEMVPELSNSPMLDMVEKSLSGDQSTAAITEVEWDLAYIEHERVDYWVDRFTTDKRADFGRFLERKGRYEPMIRQKLAERGMPQDLVYLAMIESGFQPKAYSVAHASGIWQFIPETGQRYGLEINRAVDERNDPEKATDAALSYLSDLHERFDSWYLAAASYNTGENRVGRIMRTRTGSERGSDHSYYQIWDHLPRETRDYVPLMIAAARISKEPERYGFGDIVPQMPPAIEVLHADPATPLATIAARSGATISQIQELNPHLKLQRTRNDMVSEIRVPANEPTQIAQAR
ncbi:MAG: lytic transglycosylase domain-containing protein [Acidobacteria bacterium]|nr:lytic transglycosylase domain-containing protein [Acidobacteriota bacterium]